MLERCRLLTVRVLATVLMLAGTAGADELEALKKAISNASADSSWSPTATIPAFSAWIASLAFSPDGQTLYVGGKDQVTLVSVADKAVKSHLPVKVGQVRSLAVSPDGKSLAAGGYQKLQLWDLDKAALSQDLKGHRGVITAVAFSPNGQQLATSSDDESARIWQLAAHTSTVLAGHNYPVMSVAWNHAGTKLVTIAGDETRPTKGSEAILWDAAGVKQKEWTDHTKAGLCAAFSPDDRYLITGGLDDRAIVYDLQADKALGYYGGHQRPVNAVKFSPDGKTVASIGGGRNKGGHFLKLWNREDGDELSTGEFHAAKILALAMTADGKLIATGGQDNTIALWQPPAAKAVPAQAAEATAAAAETKPAEEKFIRVGVIGLDTSHAPAFAKLMNDPKAMDDVAGCKVVAAYPKGSPDIPSSTERVPAYTDEFKKMGIEIVDSIPALLEKVDCVLLETNDGRPHLEQVLPVLKAGKPCFIDKPIAGSLTDAVAIFQAAKHYKVPVFSSSSLRYTPTAQEARAGKYGTIHGCDAFSPAALEKTHPDLFWYGIHGVELLFTTMGAGCESVSRVQTDGLELCAGVWKGGRIGTFRGIRVGPSGYGGKMFTAQGIKDHGTFAGYRPLAVEIVKFFKTKNVPIAEEETLEIYAFMEAADESKRQGGKQVKLADVLEKAQTEATTKLAALLK